MGVEGDAAVSGAISHDPLQPRVRSRGANDFRWVTALKGEAHGVGCINQGAVEAALELGARTKELAGENGRERREIALFEKVAAGMFEGIAITVRGPIPAEIDENCFSLLKFRRAGEYFIHGIPQSNRPNPIGFIASLARIGRRLSGEIAGAQRSKNTPGRVRSDLVFEHPEKAGLAQPSLGLDENGERDADTLDAPQFVKAAKLGFEIFLGARRKPIDERGRLLRQRKVFGQETQVERLAGGAAHQFFDQIRIVYQIGTAEKIEQIPDFGILKFVEFEGLAYA